MDKGILRGFKHSIYPTQTGACLYRQGSKYGKSALLRCLGTLPSNTYILRVDVRILEVPIHKIGPCGRTMWSMYKETLLRDKNLAFRSHCRRFRDLTRASVVSLCGRTLYDACDQVHRVEKHLEMFMHDALKISMNQGLYSYPG